MVAVVESMIFGKPLSYIKKLIEEDEARTPAPEVDEAAVWTRKVFQAIYKLPDSDRGHEGGAPFNRVRAYLRTALSELIASKNAEIERLRNVAKVNCDIANDCASELAALRAEIERRKANEAHLRQLLSIQEGISDTCLLALWAADKAAERNTAEPATDTAPEVVVTDGDWTFARTLNAELFWAPPASTREKVMANFAAKYRTEAEARGRREAFREVKHVMFKYEAAIANASNCQRLVDELRGLIMTEPKP